MIATLFLSGCSFLKKKPPESQDALFPANLIVRCPDIPPIGTGDKNLGDLMTYSTQLMEQYNECAMRHDKLVKIIEKNAPAKKN
jgi:hypothetical protein